MVSPVEVCRVQAGGTSDYPGCRDDFPELRRCFVLHSTGKHNDTLAIGYGNRLYQNCTHGLCWYLILPFIYYIWESTQHLNTALLQNYHCKWPSPKEHRAWFHTGFKATGKQRQYRLARQGLCRCSCIPNQCMLTASGRAS